MALRKLQDLCRSGGTKKLIAMLEEAEESGMPISRETLTACLHIACRVGNASVAKPLIDRGADVNARDPRGFFLLTMAVTKNSVDVLDLLLADGADVNPLPVSKTSPLFVACEKGLIDVFHRLVDRGADVNASTDSGYTPMMIASLNNQADIVLRLVSQGGDFRAKNNKGQTALILACQRGSLEAVDALVGCGDVINVDDKTSKTPLMVACSKGNEKVVKYLIEHGADVNFSLEDGTTAFHLSAGLHLPNIPTLLFESGADYKAVAGGESVLYKFANRSRATMIKYFVDKGVDFTVPIEGVPPFHGAFDNIQAIRFFHENGYPINEIRSREGKTALMCAFSWSMDLNTVQMLLDAGVDVNAQSHSGETALTLASRMHSQDCLACLIRHGADVNMRNNDGETALFCALDAGRTHNAKLLIQAGADLNIRRNDGKTALFREVKKSYYSNADLLLQVGADINICDNEGVSVLMNATNRWTSSDSLVQTLISMGANVNHVANNGDTALLIAIDQGDKFTLSALLRNGAHVNGEAGRQAMLRASSSRNYHMTNILSSYQTHPPELLALNPLLFSLLTGNFVEAFAVIPQSPMCDSRTEDGSTPMTIAAKEETMFNVLFRLLEAGADINDPDGTGSTPLLVSLMHNKFYNARFLIEKGADVNLQNKDGLSPLMVACQAEKEDIVRLLVDHGADVSLEDNQGRTALEFTKSNAIYSIFVGS